MHTLPDRQDSCGCGDDGAWCGLSWKNCKVKPPEIAVEILGGDAAMVTQEGFEPLMPTVDGLDVQFAPDTLAGSLVERLVTDAQRGGTGWITGASVGDQESVLIEDRLQNRLQMSGGHRRQHGADGDAGAVGGHQNRNLLVRQSPFGRLAAALAGLAIEIPFAFATAQDCSAVRF